MRFGLTSIAWRNNRHGGDGAKAKFGSQSLRLLERGFKEGKLFPFVCIKQKSTVNLWHISDSRFLKNWFIWSGPGTVFWHENGYLSKSHDLIWKENRRRFSHGLVPTPSVQPAGVALLHCSGLSGCVFVCLHLLRC